MKKIYFSIFFIAVLTYFRTLFFEFTYLDDNVLILENNFFLRNLGNFPKIFVLEVFHVLHSSAAYYRPMLTASYMIDAVLGKENPLIYHFSSILLHGITSCIVLLFLIKMNVKKNLAIFFTLIFSVHPVFSQAVAWIPGRNDQLLAFFGLLTLIYFHNYINNPSKKDLFFGILFFLMSLFTKESAIFFPIFIFGLFIVKNKTTLLKKKISEISVLMILCYTLWFFLRSIALSNTPVKYKLVSSIFSIFNNAGAYFLYLGKFIAPYNLSVLPTLKDSNLTVGIISFILLCFIYIFNKKFDYQKILFGLMFFIIFLGTSFIRPAGDYPPDFIEHRLYFPIIGLFILLSSSDLINNINFNHITVRIFSGLIICILFFINLFHQNVFKNKIPFWENAAQNSPSHPLAHKNLGAMYYLDKRFDESMIETMKAIELNPNEPMAHNNLGLIYMSKDDFENAKKEFILELSKYPNYDNSLFNLGFLEYKQGNKEVALKLWLKTVSVNPDHKDALAYLAVLYHEMKDDALAQKYYYEAIKRGVKFKL